MFDVVQMFEIFFTPSPFNAWIVVIAYLKSRTILKTNQSIFINTPLSNGTYNGIFHSSPNWNYLSDYNTFKLVN